MMDNLKDIDRHTLENICKQLKLDKLVIETRPKYPDNYTVEDGTEIVLCYVSGSCQPFVTWQRSPDEENYWGHYFDTLHEALEDFKTR